MTALNNIAPLLLIHVPPQEACYRKITVPVLVRKTIPHIIQACFKPDLLKIQRNPIVSKQISKLLQTGSHHAPHSLTQVQVAQSLGCFHSRGRIRRIPPEALVGY